MSYLFIENNNNKKNIDFTNDILYTDLIGNYAHNDRTPYSINTNQETVKTENNVIKNIYSSN